MKRLDLHGGRFTPLISTCSSSYDEAHTGRPAAMDTIGLDLHKRESAARRHVRAELAVRDALVRTRTRYIAVAKTLVRRDGLRVAASDSHLVAKRIGALDLSATLSAELFPLFEILAPINEQIVAA